MTDLDPEIWENKTLGSAAQNENLDRLTRQIQEDRSAKLEGRDPREIVVDNTYPDWTPEVQERTGTVPSNYQSVHFADEQQNDIPDGSGQADETALGVAEENDGSEDTGQKEPGSETSDEVAANEFDSTSSDESTQW